MRPTRRLVAAAWGAAVIAAVAGCAPPEEPERRAAPVADKDDCAVADLPVRDDGVLTVGTDSPTYAPWFVGSDPRRGEGFEAAVAYAVAADLGFDADQVRWVDVDFGGLFVAEEADYDFVISQAAATAERAEHVDFSEPYYVAAQVVVALDGGPAAGARSRADLAALRLGAQRATGSLSAIEDVIAPAGGAEALDDIETAEEKLAAGDLDAIVADLPTAYYLREQIPDSVLVGQFRVPDVATEEYALVLEQGSDLAPCLNRAIEDLRADGTLRRLERTWLVRRPGIPVLRAR